ncbi:hypothetical protein ADIWIN_1206 [Winogradskyella psychrotolerans RS-3]|uniref:Uncharacterized protein n=1 Tax=Winogradskyella psychrotolerans RS-3 TaxID=641526 RepID=S7VUW9_9FLAO|nr:hypothetical protein [Winogradskyella psychrotolerans]EPR73846.1 hypothetical protein ADIWIN_1206 [Winogradskyella psychrotolerans RS-3]
MNTKKITVFVLLVMVLSANAFSISHENIQEKIKVTTTGTFDGYDPDDGYAFLINEDADDEDSEETVYFSEITAEALKAINLKSKDMVGKRFEITYEITEFEEVDENGYTEVYETYKIVQIKKL